MLIIPAVILVATVLYLLRILSARAGEHLSELSSRSGARFCSGSRYVAAADVIRTVALAPSLQNVLVPGLLVLIWTFLGWSLVVEIEERWPWQPCAGANPAA